MKKQIYNPYLPSFEYIPDGEPRMFDSRIYIYGSHDRFRSAGFCLNDYVCYSADAADLTKWQYEGVIYRKEQDPRNQNIPADPPEQKLLFGILPEAPEDLNPKGIHAMWAPDVVRGLDGRYYLYYCLDFLPEIGVAVCDTPAGKYEFLGLVKHGDGTALGRREGDLEQFDPGVFIDEDGTVYLYSGNAPMKKEYDYGRQGSQVMRLMPDMLTLAEEPRKLLPDVLDSAGTGYEGHEFYEASSIRKINGKYYFVYSSVQSHELCYAVSDRPDGGYCYGGTLVDIGDVFLKGRTEDEAVNCLGNTHGGIEKAGEQWYVFYHRQTNRTNFSRQGCAEKIFFDAEGRIAQAEVTSCGLNDGPLDAEGMYPANICCHLTAINGTAFSHPDSMKMNYPYLTQDVPDMEPIEELIKKDRIEPVQYIKNMQDGSTAGYKYFSFQNLESISVQVRGDAEGMIEVRTSTENEPAGYISICPNGQEWREFDGQVSIKDCVAALYFTFKGRGSLDFRSFSFRKR
ncbi:MAG: family 43 glycosylhydrolase [Roseburia sp.]|nr:family 43 glycosylhydrolase [Roseburia sp.]